MRFSLLWSVLVIIILGLASRTSCKGFELFSENSGQKYAVIFGMGFADYLPGSLIRMDISFKNLTTNSEAVSQEIVVLDKGGVTVWKTVINLELTSDGKVKVPLLIPAPKTTGIFTLTLGSTGEILRKDVPSFEFFVIQPVKSARLSKILVFSPLFEEELNNFLKFWEIKAPNFSWAQVLLLGKSGWLRYLSGDPEIKQLIARSLKREMSVIFLDFGSEAGQTRFNLPFDVSVRFNQLELPEQGLVLKSGHPELIFGLPTSRFNKWNGVDGFTVPTEEMKFEGKGVNINALATSGDNPIRYPLVELIPQGGRGKIYLSQLITDGRIDETVQSTRFDPDISAYDPMAVQLLLNLISESVGDDLLK